MMVCGIKGIRYVIEFNRIDKKESQLSGTMHGYKYFICIFGDLLIWGFVRVSQPISLESITGISNHHK